MGVFGLLALVLATVGLYGVISFGISQRCGDLCIRMALGADRSRVTRMVLGEAARLAAVGITIGLAAALGLSRGIGATLRDVDAPDPATTVGAVLVLAVAASLTAYMPARRAARVDPIIVLRGE
jgi:ABC-type antimicrobial peptide transport system permease subunit